MGGREGIRPLLHTPCAYKIVTLACCVLLNSYFLMCCFLSMKNDVNGLQVGLVEELIRLSAHTNEIPAVRGRAFNAIGTIAFKNQAVCRFVVPISPFISLEWNECFLHPAHTPTYFQEAFG